MKMGIIAEDDSDVAVLREITSMLLRPHKIGFRRFVGDGCGKVRRKCGAWAVTLVRQGCPWIVVVHDLDIAGHGRTQAEEERRLRAYLVKAIRPAHARASVVLIPKREIEAWLLYDAHAIAAAFHESRLVRLPGDPESLPDPKKHLRDLVRRHYRKDYLNTIHNSLIAKHIDVSRLGRSNSFAPHPIFTASVKALLR